MEFWGAEVNCGGPMKVQPGEGKILHISQACLGEVKKDKGNDYIRVYVQKNGQKFVIGMLSPDRFPNINLDLVFEDEFELSHDLKHGSVHFTGYRADNVAPVNEDESDDGDELVPIDALNNGKPEAKDLQPSGSKTSASVKIETGQGKSKVKIMEPSKNAKKNVEDNNTDDDADDSDDDDDSDESVDNDEEKGEDMASSGSDEDDESDEDSDEETPKKSEPAKKRPGESTSKALVVEKKAKFATPQQKTDGKKVSGHVATPHPAKHAGKTTANVDKSNKQTPNKTFSCSFCSKTFGSDQAVQSHTKAKHSGN